MVRINIHASELFPPIFRHLELELITQFPAPIDEKNLPDSNICLTEYPQQTILSILMAFYFVENTFDDVYYTQPRITYSSVNIGA